MIEMVSLISCIKSTEVPEASQTLETRLSWYPTMIPSVGKSHALFAEENNFFIVTVSSNNDWEINKSSDGGKTWTLSNLNSLGGSIPSDPPAFASSSIILINANDKLWRTNDGITWRNILSNNMGGISFRDSKTGWTAIAPDKPPDEFDFSDWHSAITSDGGITWTKCGLPYKDEFPSKVSYSPSMTWSLWTHYYDRSDLHNNSKELRYSSDGGCTWTAIKQLSIQDDTNGPLFYSDMIGWFIYNHTPGLTRTIDGGKTWFWKNLPDMIGNIHSSENIFFVSSQIGWVINDDGTPFQTTDGGTTWSEITHSDLMKKIHMLPLGNGHWPLGEISLALALNQPTGL